MSSQMLAPQPYFVVCIPACSLAWAPAYGPGLECQPQAWMQVASQSVDAKQNMPEQPGDDFDGSTPEASPRTWQDSPPPSPWQPGDDFDGSTLEASPRTWQGSPPPSPWQLGGDFDGSTPEPSPRTWQDSPPPSPFSDLYPSSASTDYSPSQAGDNYFAVDAQIFFPMASMDLWNSDHSSGLQQTQEPELTTGSLFQEPDQEFTLVIRNIPARYTPEMLLAEFGPDATFNFLFLPYSFKDGKTMGCAFINFRSPQNAAQFQEKWHRRFLQNHGKTKHLDITAATDQGLEANLVQFNEKSVARLQRVGMLPIILGEAGERLDAIDELQKRGIIPRFPVGRRN